MPDARIALAEETLSSSGALRLRATGGSMLPAIAPGATAGGDARTAASQFVLFILLANLVLIGGLAAVIGLAAGAGAAAKAEPAARARTRAAGAMRLRILALR